jgi:hypothetical protein
MWSAESHSDDENFRWAWLRSVEWVAWPLFISQPLVPILLYFYPWFVVLASVIVATFAWRLIIVPFLIIPAVADFGSVFVTLRFATSPVMAFLIWQKGQAWTALLALLWPLFGNFFASWLLGILYALISLTPIWKNIEVGSVQSRFLQFLGYSKEIADNSLTQ